MPPTPPGEPGRRQRGSADTRSDILAAALRCFTRRGYNNTTMDAIVAESNLSKGTLYWYFDSKEELFEAALLSIFESFGDDTLSALAPCQTAAEKLRQLGLGAAAFSDSIGAYFSLFLEFWVSRPHPDEANRVWYDLLEEYKVVISSIIQEGIDSGEFRPVDVESLVWALMAAYDGLAAYAGFIAEMDLPRISEAFSEALLNGLRANAHGVD